MSTDAADQTDVSPGGADVSPAKLEAPQIILDAHMLRSWYAPADPDAVAALLPDRLNPLENRQVFLNQYVVESEEQTSGFGAYELTYAGPNVAGHDVGGLPGHWLSEYLNSSPVMRSYSAERGFPVSEGRTRVVRDRDLVTATTEIEGRPLIRTVARVGDRAAQLRGQVAYITDMSSELVLGRYPFVAEVVDPMEIVSIDFLDPDHPIYALRPEQPLEIAFALYAPRISFAYPGGECRL
jgi:hypothetical protein